MNMQIHINIPTGHYIGQVRLVGHKKWETVTEQRDNPESAMAEAVLSMSPRHIRARVLFVDAGGYYEPNIVMECKR